MTLTDVKELFPGRTFEHDEWFEWKNRLSPEKYHTLWKIEYTRPAVHEKCVLACTDELELLSMVFYPSEVERSLFMVRYPCGVHGQYQEGAVNLLKFAVLMEDAFEGFIKGLHDMCSDFGGLLEKAYTNIGEEIPENDTIKDNYHFVYHYVTQEYTDFEDPR